MNSIYSYQATEFAHFLADHSVKEEVSLDFYRNTFGEKKKRSFQLSDDAKKSIEKNFDLELPEIDSLQKSADGTIKFLLKFKDGKKVEAVALNFHKNYTLCLSSQVGCAMKCDFCLTATQGLERNLKAHEIVSQYIRVMRYLHENAISKKKPNIVFMGQGEPLHNFDNLKQALMILRDRSGLDLAGDKITISTSGYLPGIKRLGELPAVNMAFSLHSVREDVRTKLIPLNKSYPWKECLSELAKNNPSIKKVLNIEYLLLAGVNDSLEDAQLLAEELEGFDYFINLIPFNPFNGNPYRRPSDQSVDDFRKKLVFLKVRTMVRTTKGDDILAACGQLKTKGILEEI